jgi:hypothetical protein
LRHPLELINLKLADAVNLALNPGINILFGDYLGFNLFDFGREGERVWVQARSESGLLGVLAIMLRQDVVWLTAFVLATLFWSSVLVLGVAGLIGLARTTPPERGTKLLLGGYLLLTVLIVQLAATRLGLRSSFEFLLVLGAAAWLARPMLFQVPRYG